MKKTQQNTVLLADYIFVNKKNMAVVQVGVEITNIEELSVVHRRLSQLPDVVNVSRISN